MPNAIKALLAAAAAKKGKSGAAADRYVYGALNNMGAMHGNKETAKGNAMEEKYEADHGGDTDDEKHEKVKKGIMRALGHS